MTQTNPTAAPQPSQDWCVFDIETANRDPGTICEVGAARFNAKGELLGSDSALCTLQPGVRILPEFIYDVHGITAEMIAADGIPLHQALKQLRPLMENARLLAHFAEFEIDHLTAARRQVESESGGDYWMPSLKPTDWLDTLRLIRAVYTHWTNHKLETFAAEFGIEGGGHRAEADSLLLGHCFIAHTRNQHGGDCTAAIAAYDKLPPEVGTYEWLARQQPPTWKQLNFIASLEVDGYLTSQEAERAAANKADCSKMIDLAKSRM